MPIIYLPMEFHIAQGDAKMGDRQCGIEGLTAEMVERVGVRGSITSCQPHAAAMPIEQQHGAAVEGAVVRQGERFRLPAFIEQPRSGDGGVFQPRHDIVRSARQGAYQLQRELMVEQLLLPREANHLVLASAVLTSPHPLEQQNAHRVSLSPR